jgi:predicted nucleic acid-binding protein
MSRPVLVDSTWYIHHLRRRQDPLQLLSTATMDRDVATCGLVMAEVGRGVRDENRLRKFRRAWEQMVWVPSTRGVWNRTLQLAWELDRAGKVLPIQNIHIAACAMKISAVVLSFDTHFREIPGLTVTDVLY